MVIQFAYTEGTNGSYPPFRPIHPTDNSNKANRPAYTGSQGFVNLDDLNVHFSVLSKSLLWFVWFNIYIYIYIWIVWFPKKCVKCHLKKKIVSAKITINKKKSAKPDHHRVTLSGFLPFFPTAINASPPFLQNATNPVNQSQRTIPRCFHNCRRPVCSRHVRHIVKWYKHNMNNFSF